jgi:hypothetical protein
MRNIIKILIALFFIISSFLLGKYHCSEECDSRIEGFNKQLTELKRENKILSDTLRIVRKDNVENKKAKQEKLSRNKKP